LTELNISASSTCTGSALYPSAVFIPLYGSAKTFRFGRRRTDYILSIIVILT
jgi:hypothetical protein